MTACKVSIVIPVYNVEKYIGKCLDSVVNQTLSGIEIILVNDGSSDSSPLLLKKYKAAYPDKITVYHTQNRGVSHARNYGVKRAKGKYILFVDSDDYIEHNMCELLYNKAVREDADIVICDRYDFFEYEATGCIKKIRSTDYYMPFNSKIDIRAMKYELTRISPLPWDKLYKRELLCKFPFPEGIRFEDLAVMYQLILSARTICVIPDHLYNYRRNADGSFLNTFSKETLSIVTACRKMTGDFQANAWFDAYYDEIEYICVRHIFIRYSVLFTTEHRGKLPIKKALIEQTQHFLDETYPNWRNNRYLKYSLSPKMRQRLAKYKRKQSLLWWATFFERTPRFILKPALKLHAQFIRIKKPIEKFARSPQKCKSLMRRIACLQIFGRSAHTKNSAFYE